MNCTKVAFFNDGKEIFFVNYQCKKNWSVNLISTMHNAPSIDQSKKKKPCVIHFYNKNKVCVDVVDQMLLHYATHTASRRWPFAAWINILDIASLNSWVIYKKATGEKISRRDVFLDLFESLRIKYVAERALLRPDPISNNLPSSKRRKGAVKECVNTTKTVCHICKLHTCGKCVQASYKVTQCKTCFERVRTHQRAELCDK